MEAQRCMRVVAAAQAAGADAWTEDGVAVHRMTGGYNNALYRVEVGGERYACKLCIADERRRAAREHGALRLLHAVGLDIAPQPVWLDESCTVAPYPTVIYRWVPGEPLDASLTEQQLAALLGSFHDMHALRADDFQEGVLRDAVYHWFDAAPYLAELGDFLDRYGPWLATTEPDGRDLRARLARLLDGCAECFASAAVEIGRGCFPLRLVRVDPNLANTVWGEDGRLRWVDWEYSGWGDPALDLAGLRWHAALSEFSEAQHIWLRDNYCRPDDDPGFEARLAVWDHLEVTHWPFLILRELWSHHNGPYRARLAQLRSEPVETRARLIRFIERAERFAGDV